jgi:hydrogenase large subunit
MASSNDPESWLIAPSAIVNRDLGSVESVDLSDPAQVTENVSRAWYDYDGGNDTGLHPWDGETTLNYTGPQPPYTNLNTDASYSWLKSPRWRGQPMEVGPLARVAVWLARGNERVTELATGALRTLDLPTEALFSTMGRTAARAIETQVLVESMQGWYDELMANIAAGDLSVHNADKWEPSTWPRRGRGVGVVEAPRGALGHWMVVENGRIANYQAVVPTTWNAGPRDGQGGIGPYEAALMDNHSLADPEMPLEIIRTVHSFDPCLACAVHVAGEDGGPGVEVKIR